MESYEKNKQVQVGVFDVLYEYILKKRKEMMKKQYYMIDVMKIIFAYLVVFHHLNLEVGIDDTLTKIGTIGTDIAVPFYFVVSGFLFFRKAKGRETKREVYVAYGKRILVLYVSWTVLMLGFRIADVRNNVFSSGDILIYWIKYIRVVLFIGEYQLWYLLGILQALIIFYLLKNKNNKVILILAIAMYGIQIISSAYPEWYTGSDLLSGVATVYYIIFGTMRNGLFVGYIYMTIGKLINDYEDRIYEIIISRKRACQIVSIALVIFMYCLYRISSICIMLYSVTNLLVVLLIFLNTINHKGKIKIGNKLRSLSTTIFLIHMIIILAVKQLPIDDYMKYIVTFVITTFTAYILNELSNKNPVIKYIIQ